MSQPIIQDKKNALIRTSSTLLDKQKKLREEIREAAKSIEKKSDYFEKLKAYK